MSRNRAFRSKHCVAALFLVGAISLPGCARAPAEKTPVWMGQLVNGAPTLSARPVSWKAMKFNDLVRQQTDFSCGAAVMATIFNGAYGHQTTERQVLVNMLKVADPDTVRQKGFSLLDMKTYARSVGMNAEGYRIDYPALAKLEIPVVVLIDVRGYKHFVVVRKVFGDRIAIGDPALGNRTMTRAQFERAWNNIAFVVIGAGYDPDNALVDPAPPLSARELLRATASLPATEAAEFGFAPGYDFSF
jgi:predicted double-glycine peptidase